MMNMNAKEFIQIELIDGIGEIIESRPFLACIVMSAGIEFLGKCLDIQKGWNDKDPERYFNDAISNLFPKDYQKANSNDLYHMLRCGMIHSCMPDSKLALSADGNNFRTEVIGQTERTIISVKALYGDFVNACQSVINDASINVKTAVDFYTIENTGCESTTAATYTNGTVSTKTGLGGQSFN